MLRVGLTGGLGSGKSTVAQMLRELGAEVIESDELGRALMEPGQAAFDEIVRVFGAGLLLPDGRLNRAKLAELAFKDGRVKELNAIVHPAVIEAQRQWMTGVFARDPAAIAVVVSALIFEVERDARASGLANTIFTELRKRIDRVVLVGPSLSEEQGRQLRFLVEQAIREKAETRRDPVREYAGERVRVEMSHLSLETPEGLRRVARYMADAVMDALKGKDR